MPEFSEYTPGTPCWIDLQTSDPGAGAEFYSGLFGWERQDLGPEAGGYGFFLKGGRMVGGCGPTMAPGAPSAWSTYVCVRDADETAARVRAAGGTVVLEPMDVMTAGRMAVFIDPAGAAIGIWQPREHKGAQVANEEGTWGWSECQTRDVDKANGFYTAVFGWKAATFAQGANYTIYENDGRGIGGCMPIPDEVPKEVPSSWLTYFGVADTDATVETAKGLGGHVVVPPTDIPSVGRFAVVSDPQGAVFAVIRPEAPAEG